jgi:hypothetical protein
MTKTANKALQATPKAFGAAPASCGPFMMSSFVILDFGVTLRRLCLSSGR